MARRLNQTQLHEDLGLTKEAVDYIRENNIIRWSKVGNQIYYDGKAIEIFLRSFDVREHLTISECAKKLKKYGFYSTPDSSGRKVGKKRKKPKLYSSKRFGPDFYITVQTLIDGSDDTLPDGRKFLPDEYRLEVRALGKTRYIPRKSFAKTLKWLRTGYNDEREPEVQWVNVKPEKKRTRKIGKTMKTIKVNSPVNPKEIKDCER